MTTKYCDHGLYGTPVAAGTVPSAAEEGNGKGIGAATMATLVVTFSGQPSDGQMITIAGVTFTAKASGATGNQFNIGATTTDTATNLKNAINASTTNATHPSGAIASTAPLRNIVNATSSGAVVTVYTRASGSEWNSVTENSTLSNVSVTQWSGGADGAWGYVINPSAISWPTSLSAAAYGLWSAAAPYLNPPANGDVVYMRCNKLITFSTVSATLFTRTEGTVAAPVTYIVDTKNIWTGDADNTLLEIKQTSGSYTLGASPSTTGAIIVKGAVNIDGSRNLLVNIAGPTGSYQYSRISNAGSASFIFENLHWKLGSTYYGDTAINTGTGHKTSKFINCKLESPLGGQYFNSGGNSAGNVIFEKCDFSNLGNASQHAGMFNSSGSYHPTITLESCKFSDFVIGSWLLTSTASRGKFMVRNPQFGNVTNIGGRILAQSELVYNAWVNSFLSVTQQRQSHDFVLESRRGLVEWNSGRSFPTLNATLPNGNKYSLRILPTTQSGNISREFPLESPRLGKMNTLADATRTITFHFALEQGVSWTKNDIEMLVVYTDASGNQQTVSTQDYSGGALSSDSGVTWSSQSDGTDGGTAGQVKYDDSGLLFFNKYKLEVTTPSSVKQNTEVGVYIIINNYATNVTKYLFACLDFGIA